MADTPMPAIQWVIMRRAGLHPEFEQMTLLGKYEAYNERQEHWAHALPNTAIQHYLVWRVEGHIIRFAQLMQLNTSAGGMMTSFAPQGTQLVKETVAALFKSEFETHMNLVYTYTAIGNDWMPSFQNMAVDRWENAQLAKLSSGGTGYHIGRGQKDDPMMAMMAWMFGGGEPVDNPDETVGKLPEKKKDEFPPQQNDSDLDLPSASEDDSDIWNWGNNDKTDTGTS